MGAPTAQQAQRPLSGAPRDHEARIPLPVAGGGALGAGLVGAPSAPCKLYSDEMTAIVARRQLAVPPALPIGVPPHPHCRRRTRPTTSMAGAEGRSTMPAAPGIPSLPRSETAACRSAAWCPGAFQDGRTMRLLPSGDRRSSSHCSLSFRVTSPGRFLGPWEPGVPGPWARNDTGSKCCFGPDSHALGEATQHGRLPTLALVPESRRNAPGLAQDAGVGIPLHGEGLPRVERTPVSESRMSRRRSRGAVLRPVDLGGPVCTLGRSCRQAEHRHE